MFLVPCMLASRADRKRSGRFLNLIPNRKGSGAALKTKMGLSGIT